MPLMARKETINVYTDPAIAKQFRLTAEHYGGRVGMCLSAAMLAFLEMDPKRQGELIQRVFQAQLRDEVESLVEAVKAEQARRIEEGERQERGKSKRRK